MPVRKLRLLQKGIRARDPKTAVRLPGALSLTALERDGKHGIPSKKQKIFFGLFKEMKNMGVSVGKEERKASASKIASSFDRRNSKSSRSESVRARPSRESGRHSSTRISPSNQHTQHLVLPHESAL